ncbi:NAD(P)-binding protein [Dothidotthia symphoricarpi CBS 119687]|uniref:NAD(P)-binding protein n=1 Tax=Dothidotthia symphoricarpi CBS 119687 TaxID=1392245 RepID=A0A6A6A8I4_9PLEO|nr:NAD(P)-binding protein [Dothidotthia symphoricarpi CBS 119687]KAF2128282.1 NAD(P)-binding protein [Dothidotthia symphoricarpi CBS 119687]
MSRQLLAIFGATGNQGFSIANFVLNDRELAQRYNVRAVSRDISNSKMQELKSKGAELAQADLNDPKTLPSALKDVTHTFFMTTTQYQGGTREIETRQAKDFCAAAMEAGVQYIIFSSMSHPFEISDGKLKNVEHFDVKAEIEEYIRSLPIKAAFFAPGSFMQNLQNHMKPRPSPANDGTFVLANCGHGYTALPLIDITDTGRWVGAILADPDKYEGKFFAAAEGLYTMDETAAIVSKVTGKTVRHHQLPDEVFRGFMPGPLGDALFEMHVFMRDYGYYGKSMKEDVDWARKQSKGELRGLEKFLRAQEYSLE